MKPHKKVILSIGVLFFLFLAGRFIYFNVIIPEPYQHELKACLLNARALPIQEEKDSAENTCFRAYPHFN